MSEQRKTKVKEAGQDKIELEGESRPLAPEQAYLRRKAEVTRQDHAEFLHYQQEKARAAERPPADPKPTTAKVNRRNFLTVGPAGSGVAPLHRRLLPWQHRENAIFAS